MEGKSNDYIIALLVVFISLIYGAIVYESIKISELKHDDIKVLNKINKLKLEDEEIRGNTAILYSKFELVNDTIVIKDSIIKKLRIEIRKLKQDILAEFNKGKDVTEKLTTLESKETELNEYLSMKSKEINRSIDKIKNASSNLLMLTARYKHKKESRDSLEKILIDLGKKCE